ncbi:MAG: 30S ribosomal protein S20 [Candidatus Marinimicrobia bacterium]|nr:30S ribosomal protein S20 [Candidatus Neomarinimicrobiota bacterium]MBL7047608.1 30S ribosomal protein S20 [Candidatus Neomarinimicrobiota bacterium]
MTEKKNLSVQKRERQQQKAYLRNKHYKSQMKTAIKKVLLSTTREEGEKVYRQAVSIIDSLVSKGIIHKNTAGRKKSQITKYLNSLS